MLNRFLSTVAMRCLALIALSLPAIAAHAVGLGQLNIQSWLGHPLRATIPLLGSDHDSIAANCLKARLETADGSFLGAAQVTLARQGQATSVVLATRQAINEPAIGVTVTVDCGTVVNRNYQVLLDPPVIGPAQAEIPKEIPPSFAAPSAKPADRAQQEAKPEQAQAPRIKAVRRPRPAPVHQDLVLRPSSSTEIVPEPARPKVQKNARAVLKLSGSDEPVASEGLRMSGTLSEATAPSEAQAAEELRLAQAQFAAILRDEDPLKDASAQARSARDRNQIMLAEIQVLEEQRQLNQALLAQTQPGYPWTWVAGLAVLLLACLIAIAWLAWRMKKIGKARASHWADNLPTITVNTEQITEQIIQEMQEEIAEELRQKSAETTPSASQPVSATPAAAPTPASGLAQRKAGERRPDERGAGAIPFTSEFTERRMERRDHADAGDAIFNSGSPRAKKDYPPAPLPELRGLNTIDSINAFHPRANPIKVEEISDVLQEAEFWMLLNDQPRVLEILEPFTEQEQPDSPVPWLYLLETYRKLKDQPKYEALRERFSKVFNIYASPWQLEPAEEPERGLEDFPHLIEQICALWPGPDCTRYLEYLLVDNRDGTRSGFEVSVYRDVMMLIGVMKELEPAPPL